MAKEECKERLMWHWGTKTYNLLDDKNSWIRGDIGEEIARHYFSDCGLIAYLSRIGEMEQTYSMFRVNKEQRKYLQQLTHGTFPSQRWWDLVALQGHPEGEDREAKIWLIEVKTAQGRLKSTKSLQKEGKLADKEQILYEKSLGFRHLLVYVRLMTDWKVEVSCQKI